MAKKSAKSGGSIQWTGKNLAEVKAAHQNVAHHPENPKAPAFHRDASQHPDNLHVTTAAGHTLVVGIGDTLTTLPNGQVTVQKGTTAPRKLTAPPASGGQQHSAAGTDSMRGKGGTK